MVVLVLAVDKTRRKERWMEFRKRGGRLCIRRKTTWGSVECTCRSVLGKEACSCTKGNEVVEDKWILEREDKWDSGGGGKGDDGGKIGRRKEEKLPTRPPPRP